MAGDDGKSDFVATLMDTITTQITEATRASFQAGCTAAAAAAAVWDSEIACRPDVHDLSRCISMSIVAAARVNHAISASARKGSRARLTSLKKLTERVKTFFLAHHVHMNGRAVANVIRSLVDLAPPQSPARPELLDIVATRLLQCPQHFNCVESGMLIGTFARVGYHPGRRLVEIVCTQVGRSRMRASSISVQFVFLLSACLLDLSSRQESMHRYCKVHLHHTIMFACVPATLATCPHLARDSADHHRQHQRP